MSEFQLGKGGLEVFDNGVSGRSDIEGKTAREAASKCGQRASFNRAVGTSEMDGQGRRGD